MNASIAPSVRGCRLSQARHAPSRMSAERGSFTIIVAIVLTAIVGIVGLSIDFGKAYRVRSQLQSAVDAAALAAGQKAISNPDELKGIAQKYFEANGGHAKDIAGLTFDAVKAGNNGVTVTAAGPVQPYFLRVIGVTGIDVAVRATSGVASNDLEVALVLDNTGSMRDFMGDLKLAAKDLVTTLYASSADKSKIKVGVVPYVGAVNIGNGAQQMAWMDTSASSDWHGRFFRWAWFGFEPGCSYTPGSGGGSGPGTGVGGNDRQSFLNDPVGSVKRVFAGLFGIAPATAATAADVPSPYRLEQNCFIANPGTVNHFDLFNALNVQWKGCVEARAEPYDVDDTPPSTSNPNTLFVPYFWPDEPDSSWSSTISYPNNYLSDGDGALPAIFKFQWVDGGNWDDGRARNILKYYAGNAATIASAAPNTKGPNAACPDPVLPLTNSEATIKSKIDVLSHWEGSGTVSSEGLMWGWRLLSPGVPFTEGKPYGEANKVIVLMTDGMNMAAEQAGYATYTDYTAYGFLTHWRINPATYQNMHQHFNNRLLAACSNAKAAGITIYTVTFGNLSPEVRSLYEQCATKPPYAYSASTVTDLKDAFKSIAGSLTVVRLKN